MPAKRYGEGSVYYDQKRDLWIGQVMLGNDPTGKPIRRKVTARKKADMLTKMDGLKQRKASGLSVQAHKSMTTADCVQHFLEVDLVLAGTDPETIKNYATKLRLYILPHIGRIQPDRLTPDDINEMMLALKRRGISDGVISQSRSLLSRAIDSAVLSGKASRNAVKLTRAPRTKRERLRVSDKLTEAEVRRILKTLKGDRLETLGFMALNLGLRPGELFGLTWEKVDFPNSTITIDQSLRRITGEGWELKEPKTVASDRILPVPGYVMENIRDHQERQRQEIADTPLWQGYGFVFTANTARSIPGEPLHQRAVNTWWRDILQRAEVEHRRPYAWRHTAATLMLNNGVPLEVVSKILGHSGLAITSDVYAEVQSGLMADAAEVMHNLFGHITSDEYRHQPTDEPTPPPHRRLRRIGEPRS